MSFILDALKKSETERQQQVTAEFSGIPASPPSSALPKWVWLVGGLLAINLAVLLGLVWRSSTEPELATSISTGVPAPTIAAAEPSFADKAALARQNPPQQASDVATRPVISTETRSVKPVVISSNPASLSEENVYPTIHEVRASGGMNLPELHLDIHVFNAKPEDRFVFINMNKHREGSQLEEGPVVAEITPDGVVLGHLGQYFLLPRE